MKSGYFDQDGNEITVQQWGALFEDIDGRTLARDEVPGGTLMTVWLGFVDELIPDARMFGTAKLRGKAEATTTRSRSGVIELETYDTKEDALEGHRRHLTALTQSDGD